MSINDNIDKIAKHLKEAELGYVKEYYDPKTGQTHLVNELDYKAGLNYKKAVVQEEGNRIENHMVSITTLTLIVIITLLVMVIIYINCSVNMTGIYYDKSGNKIEVHHNKALGSVDFFFKDKNNKEINKSGYLKKINDKIYGLYLDEDIVLGKYSLAGYADARDHTWSWKNNKWIME